MRMKLVAAGAVMVGLVSSAAFADTFVNGYYKQSGTYVQPHYRSNPDGYSSNNYSTQGNTNPYTGAQGTKPNSYGNSYGTGNSGSGYGQSGLQVAPGLNTNCAYSLSC
ncbi:hypothetical protein ACFX5Q_11445 [Mesorhizobium sp. IMUNJ 23033]|uniref:hypothetical protein n=1 Tax=Mesorhizobium sp. IMUNJ 23033 TaxID=3378039 RepID=UPI00384B3257